MAGQGRAGGQGDGGCVSQVSGLPRNETMKRRLAAPFFVRGGHEHSARSSSISPSGLKLGHSSASEQNCRNAANGDQGPCIQQHRGYRNVKPNYHDGRICRQSQKPNKSKRKCAKNIDDNLRNDGGRRHSTDMLSRTLFPLCRKPNRQLQYIRSTPSWASLQCQSVLDIELVLHSVCGNPREFPQRPSIVGGG